MGLLLLIHVSAGLAGLITGTIALSVRKGGPLHRRIGLLYVYVMVVMGLTGAAIAALELASGVRKPGLEATALMGLFSAYLVVTGLTTIRPPGTWSRRLDLLGLPFAASIGIAQLTLGIQAIIHPESRAIGMVTAVELIFGTIALVAVGSDLQIIRSVPLTGVKRTARHLWRMTVALLFAGFAFLPRLTKFMPTPFGPIVMAPVLAVLVTLIYWMWRIRLRKSSRGLIGVAPLCQRE